MAIEFISFGHRIYFITNNYERYVARLGLELVTPGLKSDLTTLMSPAFLLHVCLKFDKNMGSKCFENPSSRGGNTKFKPLYSGE